MERSRVSLTRVVSFSIRGIPLWKIAINLNRFDDSGSRPGHEDDDNQSIVNAPPTF